MQNAIHGNGTKKYQKLCGAFSFGRRWHMLRRNHFAGPFISGGSNYKAEQHIGVHEDYGANQF